MLARPPKSERYRDLERKRRENTGIHMNEAQERFRPALLLGKHATGHRPVVCGWTGLLQFHRHRMVLLCLLIKSIV